MDLRGLYIYKAVGEAWVRSKKVGNGKEPYDLMMVWAKGGRLKSISLGLAGKAYIIAMIMDSVAPNLRALRQGQVSSLTLTGHYPVYLLEQER
jgi:hypothetical protein